MGAKPRLISTFVVLGSVVIAALGNLFGNQVTDTLVGILPTGWRANALLLLGLVTLAATAASAGYSWLQRGMGERDPHRRSRARLRTVVVLIVIDELLAAIGGVLSNAAAGRLPVGLKPYALPLFVAVIGGAIAASLLLYGWEQAPQVVQATNRKNFLTKLQTRYTRRREDALRGAVLIALGLQEEPEAVSRPALSGGTLSEGGVLADARPLPNGTGIIEAYQTALGQLLILGAPGAGKTTLLVELGLELVQQARAESKKKLPLPVICNLSSWAINQRPLEEWLVEDLVLGYQVPKPVAQGWVASEEVLPLLDGLDEVEATQRAACVEAINTFHEAHPQLPLVVCSRIDEFRAQGVPLAVQRAVVVQPLTDEQIRAYLGYGGESLDALHAEVQQNTALREVLQTPLLLRIVVLTYEGLPLEAIPPLGDHEAWVQRVFGDYVARMLKRRRRLEVPAADVQEEVEQPEYSPEETERYLTWLARQMRMQKLVELYLEQLQPDWLPDARARQNYRVGTGLEFGLVGWLFGGLVGWLWGGLIDGLIGGLIGGLVFGLVAGVALRVGGETITPIAALHWSWRRGLIGGLIGGLVVGPVIVLVGRPQGGLVFCLLAGLFAGLVLGLQPTQVNEEDYRTPNEGIRRSVSVAVITVLACILVVGLFLGLFLGLVAGLAFGLVASIFGLIFGLVLGPVAGLAFGGGAALQHAALRRVLRRRELVPPHLVGFLNYAADHVLLQRVGGGYRFVHILLRDFFADLTSEGPANEGKA